MENKGKGRKRSLHRFKVKIMKIFAVQMYRTQHVHTEKPILYLNQTRFKDSTASYTKLMVGIQVLYNAQVDRLKRRERFIIIILLLNNNYSQLWLTDHIVICYCMCLQTLLKSCLPYSTVACHDRCCGRCTTYSLALVSGVVSWCVPQVHFFTILEICLLSVSGWTGLIKIWFGIRSDASPPMDEILALVQVVTAPNAREPCSCFMSQLFLLVVVLLNTRQGRRASN